MENNERNNKNKNNNLFSKQQLNIIKYLNYFKNKKENGRKYFSSKKQQKLLNYKFIFIFYYFILINQLIFCYQINLKNNRHLRRSMEYQNNNNIIFRYQCPNGCHCVPDNSEIKLIITCRWNYLKSGIFNNFPKNATKTLIIYCNNNILNNIDETFNGFNELRELKIINCQSNQLSNDLFEGLPKLRSLSIIGAKSLNKLDEEFFFRLTKLETLVLQNNGLKEFPHDGICSLQKLQVLNLSQNLLNSVRLGIFLPRPSDRPCQLINLIVLNIAENNIQILSEQDLRPFPALRQLNLSKNNLIEIELDAFQSGQVPLLQHFDLSCNKLTNLPEGLPEGLLHIDLSNNKFKLLPESLIELPGLVRLNLSGNSFNDEEINKISLKSSGMEQLDISWNLLEYIPINLFSHSTDSLLTLNLAGNLIGNLLPGQMKNFSSLQELDLSSNKIFNISIRSFEGLKELLILQLFNNSIQKIDDEAFQELGNSLNLLNISQNILEELPVAIGRLIRVKKVDLSKNKISKVYKFVLNKMSHLSRLDLSQNLLELIDNYVFVECEHLLELNLNSNIIQTISSDAFYKCPKLKKIDLSGNLLNNLGTALANLKALRTLNLSENLLEELDWSNYPDELLELFVNNNKIKRIITLIKTENGEFDERKLRKLNLHSNRITHFIADLFPFNLEDLDLSENLLSYIAKNSTLGMANLKKLDISLNKLQTIPKELYEITVMANSPFGQMSISENPLICNCEMEWLLNAKDKEGNGGVLDINEVKCLLPLNGQIKFLKEIESSSDFLCPYNIICEPNCPCCQLSSCDCKSTCPKACECFRDLNFTKNVVQCNGKKNDELDLQELPMQSSHILLSNLNISVLKKSEFFGMGRLIELHINSSNIQIIEPSAFNTINNLKSLHLSGNNLEKINGDEFTSIPNLQLLNLANNNIIKINKSLENITPNLEEINLQNNKIEELPIFIIKNSKNLKNIYLAGNLFRCDCSSNGRFITQLWISQNKEKVRDADNIQCVENVTKAKELNDTTIFSNYFPNINDDLFSMSMMEFLRQENRTICIEQSKGILFGIYGIYDIFLILLFSILLLFIIIFIIFTIIAKPKSFNDVQKLNNHLEDNCLKNNQSSDSSSDNMTLIDRRKLLQISPSIPSISHDERNKLLNNDESCSFSSLESPKMDCDIFICYSKSEERTIRNLCIELRGYGYKICLLQKCKYYTCDLSNISDPLNNLIKASRLLILYLSQNFLNEYSNSSQLRTGIQLFKDPEGNKTFIIFSNEMTEEDMNLIPTNLGKIIIKQGSSRLNEPYFWEKLRRYLPQQNNDSNEYEQIPSPAQSAFV